MKRFSKVLTLLLAAALLLALAACGNGTTGTAGTPAPNNESQAPVKNNEGNDGPSASAGDEEGGAPTGTVYNIGICQLVTHDALDAATQGFMDALTNLLGAESLNFIYQNAAGDSATCATIANGFVSSNVDLMMANATDALIACATASADIPVLGTSVTEYGVALGLSDFDGVVGSNVSGTSDLAPLDQQAEMIKEWYPDAKTVGLLYCSAEANSQYQVDNVQACLEDLGYTCTQYPFSDSNDIASVCQMAVSNNEILYIPTDNTAASNTGVIDNICRPAGVPVFCGEEGICAGCGVATLSISYYDIGYKTGEMAYDILVNGADVSQMPIEYAPQFVKKYNEPICTDLNITVPDGYEAIVITEE